MSDPTTPETEDKQVRTMESAMDTGQGADDEPSLTIGDRFDENTPDPDGDGTLTVSEANQLLGGTTDGTAEETTVSKTRMHQ